jgi:hypothetical protein
MLDRGPTAGRAWRSSLTDVVITYMVITDLLQVLKEASPGNERGTRTTQHASCNSPAEHGTRTMRAADYSRLFGLKPSCTWHENDACCCDLDLGG